MRLPKNQGCGYILNHPLHSLAFRSANICNFLSKRSAVIYTIHVLDMNEPDLQQAIDLVEIALTSRNIIYRFIYMFMG